VNLPDGSTRETNTMPQWAGSCWYYLRYLDAKNATALVGKDAEQYWMVRPLIHASRITHHASRLELICTLAARSTPCCTCSTPASGTRFCFDLGYVSMPEPFFKLVNQGLILGEDGQKMSKARGNVVTPTTW